MPLWLKEKLFQKTLLRDEMKKLAARLRLAEAPAVRRASPEPRRLGLLPLALRRGRRPVHGRRRRMGDHVARLGPGQQARDAEGAPLPAFARPALFGLHLLHRLQGQLRRVQGHGPGALRRAEVQGPDPRQDRRPQGRRHLPPRPDLFRLLHRPAHDERQVRRAVRRQGAQARGAADPAPHGSRGLGPGRHRGDRAAAGALGEEGDRRQEHLPGRRRGAELRRQRQAAARERLRRTSGCSRRPAMPAARSARPMPPITASWASRASSTATWTAWPAPISARNIPTTRSPSA